MSMRRPAGVSLVAVLMIFGGVLGLLAPIHIRGASTAALVPPGGGASIIGVASALGPVLFLLSILQIAVGFGLWRLRPWSWMLALVLEGLQFLAYALRIFMPGFSWGDALGTLIVGAIVFYLLMPHVQAAFDHGEYSRGMLQ